MADSKTVRKHAMALPEAEDLSSAGSLEFRVRGKLFAWTYPEKVDPKKPRRPNLEVLVVRCPMEEKEMLLEAAPDKFFTTDHYHGYPAILVRLAKVKETELVGLLVSAWRCQAPGRLVKQFEQDG